MKEKQVYKKIWPLPVKTFKKLFLWHPAVHIMNLNRQVSVIKTVAYSLRTDRHTDRHTQPDRNIDKQTDRKVKTEGPKIMYITICFFQL